MRYLPIILLSLVFFSSQGQQNITAREARNHIGEKVTITGTINGGTNLSDSNLRQSTFKFGDSVHAFLLTLLISGHDKNNFRPLPDYLEKFVAITGTITSTATKPEIILTDSSQITFLHPDSDMEGAETLSDTTQVMSSNPGLLDTFNDCPLFGKAGGIRLQNLNKDKNRYSIPLSDDIDPSITTASMLIPGDDTQRWSTMQAAQIIGFVLEVKPGGDEGCNCHKSDLDKIDTHIVLVADPDSNKNSQKIIIEITPRMRFLMSQRGIDWSTHAIKSIFLNQWVKVTGWMFFDDEHANASENTKPGGAHNWRATAWEIHPITDIALIDHP